jgi:hypothetical protein
LKQKLFASSNIRHDPANCAAFLKASYIETTTRFVVHMKGTAWRSACLVANAAKGGARSSIG